MAEQIISKRCSKCKEIKSISEFSKYKDYYHSECKTCFRKYMQKYRQTEKYKVVIKRYRQSEKYKATLKRYAQSKKGRKVKIACAKRVRLRLPEQYKARQVVRNAVRNDQLPRPDSLQCHYCPKQAKQYHHWKGYKPEHWLNVVPVCRKCHIPLSVYVTCS